MLAGGDAILVGIHPESAIAIATSEGEVVSIRVDSVTLDEERSELAPCIWIVAGDLASGCAFYEFCNDFFIGHGIQWLLVTLSV